MVLVFFYPPMAGQAGQRSTPASRILLSMSLAVSGSNIFAGTDGNGVFLSTNSGTTWTAVDSGLTNTNVYSLAVNGSDIFAGTDNGVFLSTNSGTSWTADNSGLWAPGPVSVRSFAVSGNNIFAGTMNGVFLSTNSGTSWTTVNSGLTSTYVRSLAVSGSNIFAGTNGGVFLSTNNGTSWTAVSSGLTNTDVRSLAVSGSNIFAGTSDPYGIGDGGVWRRPLSDIVSVLPQTQQPLPLQARLHLNGSASLRSGTMLSYSIRSRCLVRIGVYTISGKRVAVIEQGERTPGEYAVNLDAGRIPAGLYVCRFQAGNYQESSRLMVVK